MPIQSKTNGDSLELRIYDQIGPAVYGMIDVAAVAEAIDNADDVGEIVVKLNSPGGSAFDGIAIYNLLRSREENIVTVAEGLAASAASIIFMAGDDRRVHESAMLLIHQASGIVMGTAEDMMSVAANLEALNKSIAQVYASTTGKDASEFETIMSENRLMRSDEALEMKLATEIISGEVPQVMFDKRILNQFPQEVADRFGVRGEPKNVKDNDMKPEEFRSKFPDAVNDWINEGEVAAYANAKQDVQALIEACGGDKSAGLDAWLAGKSIEDARAERTQTVEQQLEEVKAKLAEAEAKAKSFEDGADPVKLNPSAKISDDKSDAESKKYAAVQKRAAKMKTEQARNAYIKSAGLDPLDFDFE